MTLSKWTAKFPTTQPKIRHTDKGDFRVRKLKRGISYEIGDSATYTTTIHLSTSVLYYFKPRNHSKIPLMEDVEKKQI